MVSQRWSHHASTLQRRAPWGRGISDVHSHYNDKPRQAVPGPRLPLQGKQGRHGE